MLADGTPIAFIPSPDPVRCRSFYEETLGLELVGEDAFALTFDAGGTPVRLTRVPRYEPAPYTIFGWEVDDLDQAISELAKRGVVMARFDGLEQDHLGVWTAPDGSRVAWFRDPDGNVLSFTELIG